MLHGTKQEYNVHPYFENITLKIMYEIVRVIHTRFVF